MPYTEVDLDTWKRKEHYLHFTKEVNCTCCLTATIEITALTKALSNAPFRFYPTFLYCICKVVNAHDEFKMAYLWEESKLVLWDHVVPSHIVFHEDSETFTRIWSNWDTDFASFYHNCQTDVQKGQKLSGYSVPNVPSNSFDVSCLPWLSYSSMSLHIPENWIYLAPIITWGKYTHVDGKTVLPVTMQIHHAVADGFHIARFFAEVERTSAELAEGIQRLNKG